MVTVNKRVGLPQAVVINGVDAGGAMTAIIEQGYDSIIKTGPDGLEAQIEDREAVYTRGQIISQDFVHIVELLTGAVGTYVFYERKSGVAAETGYIKHTITNPVIHRVALSARKAQYATITADFECMAADPTMTFGDMWAPLDSQAAPSYISAARGGYRIASAVLGALNIYHLTSFDFTLALTLVKECNDADVGYTCVDARPDGLTAEGSLNFQDSAVATGPPVLLTCQSLLAAARGDLVVTLNSSQGGAAKAITVAGVVFRTVRRTSDANTPFADHVANFGVCNDPALPLTLAGANKILAVA